MAIRRELLEGLDQLSGRCLTLGELARCPDQRDGVALRHDVDHDLDLALELASAEARRELRATYFLLHTAYYWDDPAFDLKVSQLIAYGHEIALHVNVLTEWIAGEVDDVADAVAEHLDRLRATGASVTGTAAHGDKRCYAENYINYWIWRELRGPDPTRTESGLSAEGIRAKDPNRSIEYPSDELLRRADGGKLGLWSLAQRDHGIEYEAVRVPVDGYWSDTGGRWQSGDPFEADLSSGRHQLLIHPWWWRAEPRAIFCLGTARSGSKWLAGTVDRATSAVGLHDWTLNHERDDTDFPSRPRTRFDYQDLVEDPKEAARLIRIGFAHRRLLKRDAFEVNTYLEPFTRYLSSQQPAPTLVHIHRDGRKVVRSLLHRGWYRTPFDPRHLAVPIEGWSELTQLERACWYYRHTQERLIDASEESISFERAIGEAGYLAAKLEQLGIVTHPLLWPDGAEAVDATIDFAVPPFESWAAGDRATFERICGPVQLALGYQAEEGSIADGDEAPPDLERRAFDHPAGPEDGDAPSIRIEDLEASSRGVEVERTGQRLRCKVDAEAPSNPYVVLSAAAGSWHELAESAGFRCEPGAWALCTLTTGVSSIEARLFALYFDRSGRQVAKQESGVLRSDATVRVPLAPTPGATHFAIALHFAGPGTGALEVDSLAVHWLEYRPGYLPSWLAQEARPAVSRGR